MTYNFLEIVYLKNFPFRVFEYFAENSLLITLEKIFLLIPNLNFVFPFFGCFHGKTFNLCLFQPIYFAYTDILDTWLRCGVSFNQIRSNKYYAQINTLTIALMTLCMLEVKIFSSDCIFIAIVLVSQFIAKIIPTVNTN